MNLSALAPEPGKRPLRAQHAPALTGRFVAPADREQSHLALICAALAAGESRVSGLSGAADVAATLALVAELGAVVEDLGGGALRVTGTGSRALLAPRGPVSVVSPLGASLALGVCGPRSFTTRLVVQGGLDPAQFADAASCLEQLGMRVLERNDAGLVVRGPLMPVPTELRLPRASARLKAAALLAGLAIPGITTVVEPGPSQDYAEAMLRVFSAPISEGTAPDGARLFEIAGPADLVPRDIEIARDASAAGFALAAGALVAGSAVTLERVLLNTGRAGLLLSLIEMGADLVVDNRRVVGGEEVADLRVRHGALNGVAISPARLLAAADDLPMLAVVAAFARGDSVIEGLDGLSPDAAARIGPGLEGLRANRVEARVEADRMLIEGRGRVSGGAYVAAGGDHRVAMAFAVMGLAARDPVLVDDVGAVEPHWPGLIAGFEAMGVRFGKEGWR